MRRLAGRLLLLGLAACALAGCGGGTTAADGEPLALPDLALRVVGTERTVELVDLRPGDLPLLVWAWAPH